MPRESRSFDRISGVRDPSLFVIATEGEKTEFLYFSHLAEQLSSSNISIKVLERTTSNSAPNHVLEQLNEYKKSKGIKVDDEICMVIDRDRWPDAMLARIAQECDQKGYVFALSNPCFEFWLLLHHIDIETYTAQQKEKIFENKDSFLKTHLRKILGSYNPSNINMDNFYPNITIASERAETLDANKTERWPTTIGTRVYRIISKLNGLSL